jgi:hypothetical protein
MRKIATVLVATALAVPGVALAQGPESSRFIGPQIGDWEATLSGSGTSSRSFDNHNIGISGSIGNYVTPNVMLGVRQSFSFAEVQDGRDIVNAATRGFADYVFNLGRLRPYVGVSLGGIYGRGVNDTFAAGPEVGIKYYADNRTFLFVQTEYQWTFNRVRRIGDDAGRGQFFHALGIGMNF